MNDIDYSTMPDYPEDQPQEKKNGTWWTKDAEPLSMIYATTDEIAG